MVNIDNQKLRTRLLKYVSKYNADPVNVHSISQEPTVDMCADDIEKITSYLIGPIEINIKKELKQLFKECENPEIPYYEVVMDIMHYMNEFVGDPHTVEMMFSRINSEVARKKIEIEDKVFYSDAEWNGEIIEQSIQKLRNTGTERDYQLMVEKTLESLVNSTNKKELNAVRMRLNDIIKKHSEHELDKLDTKLFFETGKI
ncbi:hypothetical protein D5R95_04855 [Methanosalsum natronophilum]|uniref:Uncharacterized protein n=1 Tax=Methanosalsum natronophilum TaxID=768733 RepID=A0A3R7VU58_9EURY|nr:MAG: hypothetical protein D5R95_04855 [Methanosalsum natronophilum]